MTTLLPSSSSQYENPPNPLFTPSVAPVLFNESWYSSVSLTSSGGGSSTTSTALVGEIKMYAATNSSGNAPTNFVFCDGTSYLTSAFPQLFGLIGYTYGGSGSNFNVPNFQTRMPIGSAQTTSMSISYSGSTTISSGNKNISTNQLASHAHDFSHTHNFSWTFQNANNGNQKTAPEGAAGITVLQNISTGQGNGSGATSGIVSGQSPDAGNNTANTGSGSDFLPPFQVVQFIIRVRNTSS
jgi:microcystin-dependent protein